MISYEIYKITHLTSLVVFYCAFAVQLMGKSDIKLLKILSGITTLLILISGMGLLARIGVSHGGLPGWAMAKMLIWLVLAVGLPVVIKRLPKFKGIAFWLSLLLFFFAAIIINYRS